VRKIQLGSLVRICTPLEAGDVPELHGLVVEMTPMQHSKNIGKHLIKVLLHDGSVEHCMLTDLMLVN
jgi:hypothetical protein